jgi:hypothetical protein
MEMLRSTLLLSLTVSALLLCPHLLWAQCPQQPNDHGICDTLYVEVYPCDTLFAGEARQVHLSMYVTHDVPDPSIDSIAAFVIPLCYTRTNPDKYCYMDPFYNGTATYPFPTCYCGIFHHLEGNCGYVSNWMMALTEQLLGLDWDTRILDYDESHIWLALHPTGMSDQRFGEGSRVLLATYMFSVEDTMTICADTCFWPPANRLTFCRSDAENYIPRHNLPYCFSISYPSKGDVNASGAVEVGDVVYLINYLFRDGPYPPNLEIGDVNCDEAVNGGDVVFLISYLFRGGPEPSC